MAYGLKASSCDPLIPIEDFNKKFKFEVIFSMTYHFKLYQTFSMHTMQWGHNNIFRVYNHSILKTMRPQKT